VVIHNSFTSSFTFFTLSKCKRKLQNKVKQNAPLPLKVLCRVNIKTLEGSYWGKICEYLKSVHAHWAKKLNTQELKSNILAIHQLYINCEIKVCTLNAIYWPFCANLNCTEESKSLSWPVKIISFSFLNTKRVCFKWRQGNLPFCTKRSHGQFDLWPRNETTHAFYIIKYHITYINRNKTRRSTWFQTLTVLFDKLIIFFIFEGFLSW